jgi:hypothetical protein
MLKESLSICSGLCSLMKRSHGKSYSSGENERVIEHLRAIRGSLDILRAAYDLLKTAFDDLDARIQSLERANAIASDIIQDFDEALHPQDLYQEWSYIFENAKDDQSSMNP